MDAFELLKLNETYPDPQVLSSHGVAKLLRFDDPLRTHPAPVLVVPSPIARWRHLHPRTGPNLVRALAAAGFAPYCLDWGEPFSHDRELSWDDLIARLDWARGRVLEHDRAQGLALLGFSLGGTLAVISAASRPECLEALVNLSGPVDFSRAGVLAWLADARWFDPALPSVAFRFTPPVVLRAQTMLHRMMSGRRLLDHFGPALEAASPHTYELMETWAQRHVPLPPPAFRTYVRELLQRNALIDGKHRVGGRLVDLASIRCPVLAIGAEHDAVCRPAAVTALVRACGSADATSLVVPGGHLGSVVGRRADRTLHDPIVRWLESRLASPHTGSRDGPRRSTGVEPAA